MARVLYVLVGYGFAVLLHALWNGSATLGDGGAFLGVYLFVMVPLFIAMVVLVCWQRRREQRTVADQLPGFAMAGWIAPSEVALLSTLAGRSRWRRAVRQRSGKAAAKAVTEYQTAVTELAFLRARMSRGAVGPQRLGAGTTSGWPRSPSARARAMGQPEALTAAWLRPPPSGWAPPPPPPAGARTRPAAGWNAGPRAARSRPRLADPGPPRR